MTQETLKLALDYLESRGLAWNVQIALREALRENAMREVQRLGQEIEQEQEPVAWGNFKEDGTLVGLSQHPEDQANWTNRKPLYTHPPQRTWVGLTDEEMTHTNHHMVEGAYQYSFKQGAKWAEAKLKEKNT